MSYCVVPSNVSEPIKNEDGSERRTQITLYKLLCPPLIFACLVSVTLNVGLIIVGRIGTHKKSPVLILSLNLACTDTIASLLNAFGFVFNSYLPVVFDIHFDTCPFLALEIVRCSALISSVLHLLALAFIHYKGIVRPLHYRVRAFFSHHVTRSIHSISAICWGIPLTAFTIYFYSIPCQGFRSINCDYDFLASKRYRLFILSFFAIPLVLMFFLYTRIFKIIRQNQQMRCQSRHGYVSESSFPKAAAILIRNGSQSTTSSKHVLIFRQCPKPTDSSTSSISSSNPITYDPQSQSMETSIDPLDKVNYIRVKSIESAIVNSLPPATQSVKHSTSSIQSNGSTTHIQSKESLNKLITMDENVSTEVAIKRQSINKKHKNDNTNNHHHKTLSKVKDNRLTTIGPTRTNTKALITSLLILGTYLLCWVPAVTFLVLTCQDGCPFSIFSIPRKMVIIISSICNFLVIMKAIVDPFIYIFRIREVKLAIRKIFNPNQRNDGRHCMRSTITGSTSGGSTVNSTNRNLARERPN